MTLPQETFANASNVQNGFASAGGLLEPIIVVFYIILVIGVGAALHDVDRFRRLARAMEAAVGSIRYAALGVITLAGVGLFLAPLYLAMQLDSGTKAAVARWGGLALAGYVGLVAVGYGASRIVNHLRATNPAFDEWVTPDPEDEDEGGEAA